ncbi:hypothetical protein AB0I55_06420 [Actinocatenispora sera]|uniref:hypothetical protein n=1 Tax=Actinocatenispora sera TaxID=390989 RepID=UPI003405E580
MTDIKHLLREIAEQAPRYEVTAAVLAAGRRRRRRNLTVRLGAIAAAAVLIAVGVGRPGPLDRHPDEAKPPVVEASATPDGGRIEDDLVVGTTMYPLRGRPFELPFDEPVRAAYLLPEHRGWLLRTAHGSGPAADVWLVLPSGTGTRIATGVRNVVVSKWHTSTAWTDNGTVVTGRITGTSWHHRRTAHTDLVPAAYIGSDLLVLRASTPGRLYTWSTRAAFHRNGVPIGAHYTRVIGSLDGTLLLVLDQSDRRLCLFTLDPRHSYALGHKTCVPARPGTTGAAPVTTGYDVFVPTRSGAAVFWLSATVVKHLGTTPRMPDSGADIEAHRIIVATSRQLSLLEHFDPIVAKPLAIPAGSRGLPIPVQVTPYY